VGANSEPNISWPSPVSKMGEKARPTTGNLPGGQAKVGRRKREGAGGRPRQVSYPDLLGLRQSLGHLNL